MTLLEALSIIAAMALLLCVKLAVVLGSADPIAAWALAILLLRDRTALDPSIPPARVLRPR
jgi:hypothetical protein